MHIDKLVVICWGAGLFAARSAFYGRIQVAVKWFVLKDVVSPTRHSNWVKIACIIQHS